MTHIRFIGEQDVSQIADLIYEIGKQAVDVRGLMLDNKKLSSIVLRSITSPEQFPCFVHEEDGELTGMLFGLVLEPYFLNQTWFEEHMFYIREQYRSFRLAVAYIRAVEEWCAERGIKKIEFGNAFTYDPRIDALYRKMGYTLTNTIHSKRI